MPELLVLVMLRLQPRVRIFQGILINLGGIKEGNGGACKLGCQLEVLVKQKYMKISISCFHGSY